MKTFEQWYDGYLKTFKPPQTTLKEMARAAFSAGIENGTAAAAEILYPLVHTMDGKKLVEQMRASAATIEKKMKKKRKKRVSPAGGIHGIMKGD